MLQNFLKEYAKLIVLRPEAVRVDTVGTDEIVIYADKTDVGRLIGKDGRMINSIKTVISAYKAKNSISYKLTVKSIE